MITGVDFVRAGTVSALYVWKATPADVATCRVYMNPTWSSVRRMRSVCERAGMQIYTPAPLDHRTSWSACLRRSVSIWRCLPDGNVVERRYDLVTRASYRRVRYLLRRLAATGQARIIRADSQEIIGVIRKGY